MLKLLYNKVTGLQLFNFIKKRLQHRCFLVNIAKFLRTPIEEHLQTAASVLLIIKLVVSIGYIYLLYQKDNVAWFLLRQFVDVVITYSLLINSRNHSNTFLLLDLQKNRRYCSKGYLFWYYIYIWYILWLILIFYDIMINVYFNDIQLNRWKNCFWNLYSIFSVSLNLFCLFGPVTARSYKISVVGNNRLVGW